MDQYESHQRSFADMLNTRIDDAPVDETEVARRLRAAQEHQDVLDATHVFVPLAEPAPGTGEGPRRVTYQLRLSNGEGVLPVFTEEAALVREMGSGQPFLRISVLALLVDIAKVPVAVNPIAEAGLVKAEGGI